MDPLTQSQAISFVCPVVLKVDSTTQKHHDIDTPYRAVFSKSSNDVCLLLLVHSNFVFRNQDCRERRFQLTESLIETNDNLTVCAKLENIANR